MAPRPAFYWDYGHLAVYAAIAAFGVGIQLAIGGSAAGASGTAELALAGAASGGAAGCGLAGRAILAGSVVVYLVAVGFVQYVNRRPLEERVALARLAVAAALLALVALGAFLSPFASTAGVAAALLALTAFETRRAGLSAPG